MAHKETEPSLGQVIRTLAVCIDAAHEWARHSAEPTATGNAVLALREACQSVSDLYTQANAAGPEKPRALVDWMKGPTSHWLPGTSDEPLLVVSEPGRGATTDVLAVTEYAAGEKRRLQGEVGVAKASPRGSPSRGVLGRISREVEALPGDGWRSVARRLETTADQLRAWLADPPATVTLDEVHRMALAVYLARFRAGAGGSTDIAAAESSAEYRAWLVRLVVG